VKLLDLENYVLILFLGLSMVIVRIFVGQLIPALGKGSPYPTRLAVMMLVVSL